MSVTLMSLVFQADIKDLPYEKDGEQRNAKASTVKLLLLAYADHANDEGESAYPGYTKLEIKTALSRQGISDTIEALKQNGLLIEDGKSKLNTNSYTINKNKLQELVKPLDSDESSHLTQTSQATRLKPSVNHPKEPSLKRAAPAEPKANQIPEIVLFRSVTRRYPAKVNFGDVVESVGKVRERIGREPTKDDLLPFFKAWCHKGYKEINLAWLEWAETGIIPQNGTWKSRRDNVTPKGFDVAQQWLAKRQAASNGD